MQTLCSINFYLPNYLKSVQIYVDNHVCRGHWSSIHSTNNVTVIMAIEQLVKTTVKTAKHSRDDRQIVTIL